MSGRRISGAIALTLALLLLANTASAQDYIVRDGDGRRVGTVEQGIGCQIIWTAVLSGELKVLSAEIVNAIEAAEIEHGKKEEITRLAQKAIQNRLRQK